MSVSLVRPLRRLRDDTLRAAEHDLPEAIISIREGGDIDSMVLPPVRANPVEEVGQVARAVDTMKFEALRLAGEQAHLRRQVNEMLETLARRNKTLVEQQLSLIESLEFEEKDPTRLQSLFALDHLAARMRRTGDSLLVLAGTWKRLGRMPDTPLGDVLRGAVSQVENYERVHIGAMPAGNLVGSAVADVAHLVAELIDNALRASPPNTTVRFAFSGAVDGGMLLEITDQGIGIPAHDLNEINERLTADGETTSVATHRMGLFVVGRWPNDTASPSDCARRSIRKETTGSRLVYIYLRNYFPVQMTSLSRTISTGPADRAGTIVNHCPVGVPSSSTRTSFRTNQNRHSNGTSP